MKRKESSLMSILLIILCFNSIIYYEIQEVDLSNNNPVNEIVPQDDSNIDDDSYQIDNSYLIKKDLIPGDFQTFAFFSGGGTEAGNDLIDEPEYPNEADNNDTAYYPNVIEWVTYNEIKDGGHIPKELYWRSLSTAPITHPSSAGEWHHLREQNFPSEPSKMFSPVFTEDWEISGRVYYLTYIRTNDGAYFSEYITITMKFSMHLFNPADNSSVELTSTTTPISVNTTLTQRTFSSEITGTYTIPAGYRLKYDIEYMYDTIPSSFSLLMYTGYPAGGLSGSLTWTITDPTYGNTYTLNNNQRVAGVQLYLRSKEFPAIDVYGVTNEAVYSSAENVTIYVTDGSISSYRWVGGTWNSFVDDTLTQLPAIHGWHYLEIKASDPIFNNTNVVSYKYGYDASAENILLNNAMSGDYLKGGFILDFSVYNVNESVYKWDSNGSWHSFTNPYDIDTPMFTGWHDLVINTTDFYENNSYSYAFYFDSDTPVITLTDSVNNSIYAPGKFLEFLITDNTGLTSLNYSWNAGTIQSWTPDIGDLYSTNLPDAVGTHFLEISVSDGYDHFSYAYYEFFTDNDFFNVDLLNIIENGYYQGGEDVELVVQRSNGTVYFKWDSGVEKLGTLNGTYLILNGSDSLPSTEGLHVLHIRTFNLTHDEHIFDFSFYIDNTSPTISNIQTYDGGRFLSNVNFEIYIVDNYANNLTELIVEYSLNGTIYQPLGYPFTFSYPYLDGFYTLDIRAQDLAGNIGNYTISFIIDNTAPSIEVIINELIDRISVDGNYYIPPDSLIEFSVVDIDANTNIFYSWNGTWTNITGQSSFTLSSVDDGEAILLVRAYDSLLNEGEWFNITLVYDSTPPVLTLTFPTNVFHINDFSDLEFEIEDFTFKNIESVIYHWDGAVGLGDFDVNDVDPYIDGYFRLELGTSARVLYSFYGYALANLTIFAEDILGNNNTYVYQYEIDITPPQASLEYLNLTWIPMVEENDPAYEIAGGSKIQYDNTTADDQLFIRYQWEINGELQDWNELDLISNPEFELGKVDGNHTLIFEIHDDTGQGRTPNIKIAIFNFYVDDMLIDFLYPIEFKDNFQYKMDYNDTFTYRVNITDAVDNEPIPGLVYGVDNDNELNLSITVTVINITIYEVSVYATNVTDYSETIIDVSFTRAGVGGQTIRVNLRIDKKIGVLNISEVVSQIMYEEDLEIEMYMENDIGQNQTINDVFVNGTEVEDFSFNNTTFICSFNYSSFNIKSKGNFSLSIFTDSAFYNASTNTNTTINFEIFPLPILITISVSNYTIIEGTDVSIYVLITYENGTPVEYAIFNLYIHVYLKNITETDTFSLHLAYEDDANYTESYTDLETGRNGRYSMPFTLNSSMDYIIIEGNYTAQDTTDDASFVVEDSIITIPLPEAVKFPQWLLYLIIGGSIGVAAIISLIIYKVTRPKSFEELMERVTAEDIALNYSIMSPGVILTIFDQRKGPIPLVADHSLDIGRYIGRMRIGVENFLLKIADQAYSSLGFEEHDAGRRVGSIILPTEKMVAFVHGAQLENKMARGGFENLSLIVLADSEFGNLLLNYQEYLYGLVDDLSSALKSKKNLKVVEDFIVDIRKQSVIIMLAAQEMEKSQGGD